MFQLLPVHVVVTAVCSVIVFINQSCNFMLLFWSMWEVFWSNEYLIKDKMSWPAVNNTTQALCMGGLKLDSLQIKLHVHCLCIIWR